LYGTDNTSDCPDDNYQQRKADFSRRLRACNQILATTRTPIPADGRERTLKSMCPVPITSFLECDPFSYICSYKSASGNSDAVAACANSFDGCRDSEYLADKEVWEKLNANCAARWERQKSRDFWMPAVSIGFMLLILVAMVFASVGAGAFAERPPYGMAASYAGGNSASVLCSFRGAGVLIVVIAAIALGSWPGLLAYYYGWWPWNSEPSALDEGKSDNLLYAGIAVSAAAGLLLLLWLVATMGSSCVAPVVQVAQVANPQIAYEQPKVVF
jgi:hypothetical protein